MSGPGRLMDRQPPFTDTEMSVERATGLQLLKNFAPLDGLKRDNLAALAKKVSLRSYPAGQTLFEEGDIDGLTLWLVSGTVEIREQGQASETIRGGTARARHPLCPHNPRPASARAVDAVRCLSIESEMLDLMITWDQTGVYEVSELSAQPDAEGCEDWMTTLLQTEAFRRIPPANLQAIFTRLERLNVKAGDTVIQQGNEGDYFYAIVSGKALVTRETPLNRAGLKLAELGVGSTFGEEALIAEVKRNATVRMLTDGVLMRLGKQDFRQLINEPLLQWVGYERARDIVARGGRWLDTRLPSEREPPAIEGALNIPLYFLRMKLSLLDPKIPYVVYCDTGRRSSAAAFILTERGFDAYVLKGGLNHCATGLRRSA